MPATNTNLPFWKSVPVIRILIALVTGIVLQYSFHFKLTYVLLLFFSLLFSFLVLNLLSYAARYRFAWLQGVFLQLFLIAAGMFITWSKNITHRESWFGHQYKKGQAVFYTLNESPVEKPRSYKAEAFIRAMAVDGKIFPATGKLIIYFEKKPEVKKLVLGSQIVSGAYINPIYNNSNPGGFNYQRYASMQQIYHTVYIPAEKFQLLPGNGASYFKKRVDGARSSLLHILRKYVNNDPAILGIAEALFIGYKADLDKDVQQAYINTGVVHIIAISGMHLGLIYLLLNLLFGKIGFTGYKRWLKAIAIIAILWFFSIMTGASASVMRSAVMFTILLLGKYFFRQNNSYNALASSALFLLLYDPYWLWDLGFQLSYAAVLGILWLQPYIYKSLYLPNRFLAITWKALSITLAAQVLTLPLTIHYFHQFPLIFPISNLVAVPLSSLILYLEIALASLFWVPGLGPLLGKLISFCIDIMNIFVQWMNGLPYAKIDNISTDPASSILFALAIILFAFFLIEKKKNTGIAALVVVFVLSGLQIFQIVKHSDQQQVVFYNAGKNPVIDIIAGDQYFPIAEDSFINNPTLQNFYCKSTRIHYRATKRSKRLDNLFFNGNLLQYRKLKLVIVKDDQPALPAALLKVDALLITGNPKIKIKEIVKTVNPAVVIIGAGNSLWKTEEWKRECSVLALRCHQLAKQGAYVLNAQ